ncbi:MAG: hypothetical protein K2K14_06190 [Ruminococcus sp.]|nr:hypothetical protein [Ruminococcus sp.]
MRLLLNNIEDAVDQKYLITKSLKNQAEAGTVIHIMGAQTESDGVSVKYRVTSTGQDYTAKFADVKQFSKWATADNFVARYQDNLTTSEIKRYIKVRNNSFMASGGIPVIAGVAVIWLIMLVALVTKLLAWWQILIGGVCLSVIVYFGITTFYKKRRSKVMSQIYNKVSTAWEGGGVVLR